MANLGVKTRLSTRHVDNRIGVFRLLVQHLDCFDGGQNKQFDSVTLGFTFGRKFSGM
jgi:hypothetical protein